MCICAFQRLSICRFEHLCICAFAHLCICALEHVEHLHFSLLTIRAIWVWWEATEVSIKAVAHGGIATTQGFENVHLEMGIPFGISHFVHCGICVVGDCAFTTQRISVLVIGCKRTIWSWT